MDSEELRARLTEYHRTCSDAADQTGGYVAQYLGDGVLIYFGYPQAQEDSAERAMRCGLQILDQMASRPVPDMVARLGTDSGLVLMSDVGTGTSKEELALGDTPNIAARIQSLAKPGTLFVSDRTWQLASGGFVGASTGVHQIKGVDEPLEIWDVSAPAQIRNKLEGAAGELSPFVGRTAQMETLIAIVVNSQSDITLVDVSGEPGIGKSRLLLELQRAPQTQNWRTLYCSCRSGLTGTPYSVFVELIQELLGVSKDATGTHLLEQVKTGLAQYNQPTDESVALIAALLGTQDADQQLAHLDGLLIGRRTRGLVVSILAAIARKNQTLLIVEDLHWLDVASEQILEQLLDADVTATMRIVTSRRPEHTPKWVARPDVKSIGLGGLEHDQCERIIRSRLPPDADAHWVNSLVERSDGNALFAEELATYFTKDRTGILATSTVPDSINALLSARVDAMSGHARRVLQLASAIGRQFSVDLLNTIAAMGPELTTVLEDGVRSELLRRIPDAQAYQFKHALIQDTLYHSMLREQRAQAHLEIARSLESNYGDRSFEVAEQLAHHYSRTNDAAKTLAFRIVAGEKNLNNYALKDARDHFEAALELIDQGKVTPTSDQLTTLLKHQSQLLKVQFEPNELHELFTRMRSLSDTWPDSLSYVVYLANVIEVSIYRRNYLLAAELGDQVMAMANRLGTPMARAYATSSYLYAQTHQAQSMVSLESHRSMEQQVLVDARAHKDTELESFMLIASAWDRMFRGETREANQLTAELAALGERIDDPRATVFAQTFTGWHHIAEERFDQALSVGRNCMDTAATPTDYRIGEQVVSFALTALNDAESGLAQFDEHFAAALPVGMEYSRTGCASGRAIALVLTGQISTGLKYLKEEIAESDRLNDPHGGSFQRMFGAELLIEMLLANEKPPLAVIARNFSTIVWLQIKGAQTAQRWLEQALTNPFFGDKSFNRARILANLAIVHAMAKRASDSQAAANQAESLLDSDDSWQAVRKRIRRAREFLVQ